MPPENHLTPSNGEPYTREEEKDNVGGHYGIATYIDPTGGLYGQLGEIVVAMRKHIQDLHTEITPDEQGIKSIDLSAIRRVQMKLVVHKSQLDDVISWNKDKDNVEGIVEMTGGEYVYVLIGITNANDQQKTECQAMTVAAQIGMVDWANKNSPAVPIPELGSNLGYTPIPPEESSGDPNSDVTNAEAFTNFFLQTKDQATRSAALSYAIDRNANAGAETPPSPELPNPDITREFNFSLFLKTDESGEPLFIPTYFDQETLKYDPDGAIRQKWSNGIKNIWGDKFGWDDAKINSFLDQVTNGTNKSWICAVEHKGELVSAALNDIAIISNQSGKPVCVVNESNEWGIDEKKCKMLKEKGYLGFGAAAVSLANATCALSCIDPKSGEVVGISVNGERLPTACYAEVNADPKFKAYLTALRAMMSPAQNGKGEIGRMEGHVIVNGTGKHATFMVTFMNPENMKELVNGKGQNDLARLIGYQDRLQMGTEATGQSGNIYSASPT